MHEKPHRPLGECPGVDLESDGIIHKEALAQGLACTVSTRSVSL